MGNKEPGEELICYWHSEAPTTPINKNKEQGEIKGTREVRTMEAQAGGAERISQDKEKTRRTEMKDLPDVPVARAPAINRPMINCKVERG